MKISVTGSNGRVGQRVVMAALKAGHTVQGIDNTTPKDNPEYTTHPSYAFLELDLRDYGKTLEALHGSDAVIHLAAFPTPQDYAVITHNR